MRATPEPLLRWLPLLPLVPLLVHGVAIGIARRPLPRWSVWPFSGAAFALCFALSLHVFFRLVALPPGARALADTPYTWIGVGIGDSRLALDLGFSLDPLSAVLLLLVTGLALIVHVYAAAYMDADTRDDRGYRRFSSYLCLLLFALLLLLLADNLVLLLAGWQAISVACWLLIGFWYSDRERAKAGGQLFVAGRVGDLGFLLGTFLLFAAFREMDLPATLLFSELTAQIPALQGLTRTGLFGESWRLLDLIALCFFFAVAAKAAQLPLSYWLPGSIAAPVPAASWIHSGALAAAGVYLVCRLSPLFEAAPAVQALMAWLGVATAAYASLLAAAQLDLRRILAFAAMGQQGLVLLALGCGAFTAALFALVSLAVVMAALFLGAGAVARAQQDAWDVLRMGDLGRRLRRTHWAVALAVVVWVGVPPFSVFFSRGAVLVAAKATQLPGKDWLWGIALASVALTAFAIARAFFLVFSGESRLPGETRERLREVPQAMLWPLYGLTAIALLGGLFGIPQFAADVMRIEIKSSHSLQNFLGATLFDRPSALAEAEALWSTVQGALLGGLGFAVAFALYGVRPQLASRLAGAVPSLRALLQQRFHLAALRERLLAAPSLWIVDRVLRRGVERLLLDKLLVGGVAGLLRGVAQRGLRHLHDGLPHSYLFFMIAGLLAVVGYLL